MDLYLEISEIRPFNIRKIGLGVLNMSGIFSRLSYGFIGAGSLCRAFLHGFLQKAQIPRERVFLSSRTPARLKKTAERFSIQAVSSNEELVLKSQVVFLCIKPDDLISVIEPLASQFNPQQTLISFPAGVSLNTLKKFLPQMKRVVRVVPNAPVSVGEGLLAYSLMQTDPSLESFVESLLSPLGQVWKMPEDKLSAFTVAASSGVAFILELMQYWNEWLEDHHFSTEQARKISTHTFLGTSLWAKSFPDLSLTQLQLQVASKKGMTAEGLKAFNEAQLDSVLHCGFEKSALREKKLFED